MKDILENLKDPEGTNLPRNNPAFLSTFQLLGRQLVQECLA